MVVDGNTVMQAAGAITALGGAWAVIQKVSNSFKRRKALHRQEILKEAREEIESVAQKLEAKINKLENELEIQKESVSKDLEHFKDSYKAEIETIGRQISELRRDLAEQHSSLLTLLTKLVDSR